MSANRREKVPRSDAAAGRERLGIAAAGGGVVTLRLIFDRFAHFYGDVGSTRDSSPSDSGLGGS